LATAFIVVLGTLFVFYTGLLIVRTINRTQSVAAGRAVDDVAPLVQEGVQLRLSERLFSQFSYVSIWSGESMESVGVVVVVVVPLVLGLLLWVLRMRSVVSGYKKQRGKSPKGWS